MPYNFKSLYHGRQEIFWRWRLIVWTVYSELSDSDVEFLKAFLASNKVQDLWTIAVEVSVWLTGSVQKNDIVDKVNRYG